MRVKQFVTFIVVVLLFSSCTQDEILGGGVTPPTPNDGKFSFSAVGVWDDGAMTHGASGSNGTAFVHPDFVVFGAMTGSNAYHSANHRFNWMYKAKMKRNGSSWNYEAASTNDDYYFDYWKNDALHSFFALAPADVLLPSVANTSIPLSPAGNRTEEDKKPLKLSYQVPTSSIKESVDVMYAVASNLEGKNYLDSKPVQGTDWTDSKVDLDFKHALSQVRFNLMIDPKSSARTDESEEVWIHSISFENVAVSGELEYDVASDDMEWKNLGSSTSTVTWGDLEISSMANNFWGGSATESSGDRVKHSWDETLSPIPYNDGTVTHIATMMPQPEAEMNDDAAIVLKYHSKSRDVGGPHPTEFVIIKKLKEISAFDGFEKGVNYIFNIIFDPGVGTVQIYVDRNAFDWNDVVVDTDINYAYFDLEDDKRHYNVPNTTKDAGGNYIYSTVDVPYKTNLSIQDIMNGKIQFSFKGAVPYRTLWFEGMKDEFGNLVPFDISKHAAKINPATNVLTFYSPYHGDPSFDTDEEMDILTITLGKVTADIVFYYGYIRPVGTVFGDEEGDIPHFNYGTGLDDDFLQFYNQAENFVYIPVSTSFETTDLVGLPIKTQGGTAEFLSSATAPWSSSDSYYDSYPVSPEGIYIKYTLPNLSSYKGIVDVIQFEVNKELHDLTITWGYALPQFGFATPVAPGNLYDYELIWPLTTKFDEIMGKPLGTSSWNGLSLSFEVKTNLGFDDFTVSQENTLAGSVKYTIDEENDRAHITYTRRTIDHMKDKIIVQAGFQTYTMDITFPYVRVVDDRRSWTLDKNTPSRTVKLEYGGYITNDDADGIVNKHDELAEAIHKTITQIQGTNLFSEFNYDHADGGYLGPTFNNIRLGVLHTYGDVDYTEFEQFKNMVSFLVKPLETEKSFEVTYELSAGTANAIEKLGDNVTLYLGDAKIVLPFVLIPFD